MTVKLSWEVTDQGCSAYGCFCGEMEHFEKQVSWVLPFGKYVVILMSIYPHLIVSLPHSLKTLFVPFLFLYKHSKNHLQSSERFIGPYITNLGEEMEGKHCNVETTQHSLIKIPFNLVF